jgi:hypothetical protein
VSVADFTNTIGVHEFDPCVFGFRDIMAAHCRERLGTDLLERLHDTIPDALKPKGLITVDADQATYLHAVLYQVDPEYQRGREAAATTADRGFIRTYRAFVRYLAEAAFRESLVFQRLPTLRVQLPGNLSVGAFHRDAEYNHPKEEINVWVPLTPAERTASIWIEGSRGAGDHRPRDLRYGQYLLFDGGLEHGNKVNAEGYTRVSFDFRIIPLRRYRESDGVSHDQRMTFRIGDYYDVETVT